MYSGPSAILFYQSSRHYRHLPILTAAAYLRAISFHFPTTSRFSQALPLINFTYEYCHYLTCGVGGRGGTRLHLSFLRLSHFWMFNNAPHIHNNFYKLPGPLAA